MNHVENLIEEIREYAKNNGRAIVAADDPNNMKKGFLCSKTNKLWEINIILFVKDMKEIKNNNKKEILSKVITTKTGCENFINFLNSKK